MNFIHEKERIYLEDSEGKLLAEINFPEKAPNCVDIERTFVDSSMRGQGIAGSLMKETAAQLSGSGQKAVCSCPYAVKWFREHPEFSHLLAEPL